MNEAALWQLWQDASQDDAIDTAIRDLYARVDAAIAERGPTCWQSGKCCKFDSYGHRLYVTGLEIAWYVSRRSELGDRRSDVVSPEVRLPLLSPNSELRSPLGDACIDQHNNLCTTHTIRPLGCRVFFCQEGTQDWQHKLYEDFLSELRRLHDAHGLEYRYMEWRAGLRDALAAQPADG